MVSPKPQSRYFFVSTARLYVLRKSTSDAGHCCIFGRRHGIVQCHLLLSPEDIRLQTGLFNAPLAQKSIEGHSYRPCQFVCISRDTWYMSKSGIRIGLVGTSTLHHSYLVQLTLATRAKQPCEDTSEGWQQAIYEATAYATTALMQYKYDAWIEGRNVW